MMRLSALCLTVVFFGCVSASTREPSTAELQSKLAYMPAASGVRVIAFEDERYTSEIGDAAKWFALAIDRASELGFLDDAIFPIRFAISPFWGGAIAHREDGRSTIILPASLFGDSAAEIAGIIVHEFSHLLTYKEREEHGVRWRYVCDVILRAVVGEKECKVYRTAKKQYAIESEPYR